MRFRLLAVVIAVLALITPRLAPAQGSCTVGTSSDGTSWVYYEDEKGSMDMWENSDGSWDVQVHNGDRLITYVANIEMDEDEGTFNEWSGNVFGSVYQDEEYGMNESQADGTARDTTGIWIDKVTSSSCSVS